MILTKLKEQFEVVDIIHWSFVDTLVVECLDRPLDLKASEVMELIHTKEGLPERDAQSFQNCRATIVRVALSMSVSFRIEKAFADARPPTINAGPSPNFPKSVGLNNFVRSFIYYVVPYVKA